MTLVLDSSATLGWLYVDAVNELTLRIFERVIEGGAWVLSIWRLEVANSLQIGVRRNRINLAFRTGALADLEQLRITVDPDSDRMVWSTTLGLADRHGVTVYDASYLELALRRGLPLASLDRRLRAAATALGVALVEA